MKKTKPPKIDLLMGGYLIDRHRFRFKTNFSINFVIKLSKIVLLMESYLIDRHRFRFRTNFSINFIPESHAAQFYRPWLSVMTESVWGLVHYTKL